MRHARRPRRQRRRPRRPPRQRGYVSAVTCCSCCLRSTLPARLLARSPCWLRCDTPGSHACHAACLPRRLPASLHPTVTSPLQAAQRGQKQGSATQPDENDPLADRYGDTELVQARQLCGVRLTLLCVSRSNKARPVGPLRAPQPRPGAARIRAACAALLVLGCSCCHRGLHRLPCKRACRPRGPAPVGLELQPCSLARVHVEASPVFHGTAGVGTAGALRVCTAAHPV